MKKTPCPGVYLVPDTDGTQRTVVHFEFENHSFQMFDDEALRLAREIHDVLEIPPEEAQPWSRTLRRRSRWTPTHVSRADGSTARLVAKNHGELLFENESGDVWYGTLKEWSKIE